jgi:NADPH2:quinone reductase
LPATASFGHEKKSEMRAIHVEQFGDPEVMRLGEAPQPAPEPGQVLVRIHAAGVNPVDTYIRSGNYATKPPLPYTPGADGAGVIERVGADVRSLAPGDRVYVGGSVSGTYAELALCNASQAHPLPAAISFEQGAALGIPYATACRALFQKGAARPGETVLIHGATGGVGLAAVQWARAHGLRVLATGGSAEGRALAAREGAHAVFDHKAAGYEREILSATDGNGVNLIIEMLANVNLGRDLEMLAPFGRVVIVGNRGRIEIDPRDAMKRDAEIRAMVLFNAPPAELDSIHAAIFAGLENGTLRPVISRRFPLAEAAAAHRTILDSTATGKIILMVD